MIFLSSCHHQVSFLYRNLYLGRMKISSIVVFIAVLVSIFLFSHNDVARNIFHLIFSENGKYSFLDVRQNDNNVNKFKVMSVKRIL